MRTVIFCINKREYTVKTVKGLKFELQLQYILVTEYVFHNVKMKRNKIKVDIKNIQVTEVQLYCYMNPSVN